MNHAMPTNARQFWVRLARRLHQARVNHPELASKRMEMAMPRRSQADLSRPRDTPLTLQPPANLGGRERKLFVEFVSSLPPKHLAQEDLQLAIEAGQILSPPGARGRCKKWFLPLAFEERRLLVEGSQ